MFIAVSTATTGRGAAAGLAELDLARVEGFGVVGTLAPEVLRAALGAGAVVLLREVTKEDEPLLAHYFELKEGKVVP